MSVVFPVPEGAHTTSSTPEREVMVGVVSGIVLLLHETLTQSVRQDGGKDHVIGIGYDDGTGFPALGGVHLKFR